MHRLDWWKTKPHDGRGPSDRAPLVVLLRLAVTAAVVFALLLWDARVADGAYRAPYREDPRVLVGVGAYLVAAWWLRLRLAPKGTRWIALFSEAHGGERSKLYWTALLAPGRFAVQSVVDAGALLVRLVTGSGEKKRYER